MSHPTRRAVVVVLLLAVGSGAAARQASKAPFDPAALAAQLQATTAPWNQGDLDAFIAPYAEASTFMTAAGPIDRGAMKARYAEKYFGAGKKPRPLRFEQIVVRPLGGEYALMTGRFVLGGDGQPEQSGWFTLVWMHTAGGWRILHDHTS